MSYTLLSETVRKARKKHRCIWCGESINVSFTYVDERSVFDGAMQRHRWHPECLDSAREGWQSGDDEEFIAYSHERPSADERQLENPF